MTHWMCISCGYYLQGIQPPNQCPGCKQTCAFNDVTCYRPECGGERNVDPMLVGATLGTLTGTKAKKSTVEGSSVSMAIFTQGQAMSGLSDKQKSQIMGLGHMENYNAGDMICTLGTESNKLYFVDEGDVMVEIEYEKGLSVPISIVVPGQAFGWSALIPPYRHTANCLALSKTRVIAVERKALLELMQKELALGLTLMQNLAGVVASRLTNLELELVQVLRGSRSAPDVVHINLQKRT